MKRTTKAAWCLVTLAMLGACGESEAVYPNKPTNTNTSTTPTWSNEPDTGGIFGPGGLTLFGDSGKKKEEESGNGIGVNTFLWRASLDTIAFMPLSSADPFGGVIITDWYQPPESPTERFKLSVFILDRTLRADGVRVAVFRQVQSGPGEWTDAPIDQKTATDMENTILTRARELRAAAKAAAKS